MENVRSGSLIRKLVTLLLPFNFLAITSSAQIGFTINYSTETCAPQTLSFTNTSTTGDNYLWDFGDGNTSAEINPSHVYLHGGVYTIRLTAYSGTTPLGDFNQSINLKGGPNQIFSNSDSVCIGEVVSLYTTVNATSYKWIFENGPTFHQSQVEHSFDAEGVYTVKLITLTECGEDSITTSIYVSNTAKPDADFWFNNPVCPNDVVEIHANNWLAKEFFWTFQEGGSASGKDISHTYSSEGIYDITLTTTNSCGQSNSKTKSISVEKNLPIPDGIIIEASKMTVCPNEPISFNTNYIGSYFWRFGDGRTSTKRNPIYAYPFEGEYQVILTVRNGCGNKATLNAPITVTPDAPFGGNPTIYKSASQVCPGDSINFQSSIEASSYHWDFGNGITFEDSSISHTWTESGKKHFSLTLTNVCGKDTTLYDSVMIGGDIKPVLTSDMYGITSETICPGDTIIFYSSGAASYTWNFGDGNSSSQTSQLTTQEGNTLDIIKHAYVASGRYIVSLDYYNSCGNSTSGQLSIKVSESEAAIADMEILNPTPYTCDPVKLIGMGGSEFIWDFGDGVKDTTLTTEAIHSYSIKGDYIVQLIVINGCGNRDTISKIINVQSIPEPIIKTEGAKLIAEGEAISWQWFKEGSLITDATSNEFIAPVSATYSVALTHPNGCTIMSPDFLHCFAVAGEDKVICTDGFVTLNAFGGSGYSWTPSDGLTNTTLYNPTANPSVTTEYIVTITEGACVAKDTVIVNVVTEIAADAGEDMEICEGDSVRLSGTGHGMYYWFEEETLNNAYIANPFVKPEFTTTYYLTVSNGSCESTDSVVVNVYSLPTVYAGDDQEICMGEVAQLNGSGSLGNYSWSPSALVEDPTTGATTSHPQNTTTYYLTITDDNGCSNADSLIIIVNELPQVDAGGDKEICTGTSTMLSGTGEGGLEWHPSTGLNNQYIPTPEATPTTSITYYLTATNNGCSNKDSVKVIVHAPVVSIEQIGKTLKATSGFNNYEWYKDNVSVFGESDDRIIIDLNGSHQYSVVATDQFGCFATASINIGFTGFNNSRSTASINAYPNPATESVSLSYDLTKSSDVSIVVTDIYGTIVKSFRLAGTTGLQTQNINTNDLPAGTYLVQISSNEASDYCKIEIIR